MQLAAVILARALLFVESFDLNPRGKAYYPDIVQGLVEKCGFQKFPQKLEDFDETKGVEFLGGKWGDVTIESVKIFNNGIMLDTRVSTAESERVIKETLGWAASQFGLVYSPKMITRRGYVSNLTFHSDVPILGNDNSPVAKLVQRVREAFSQTTGDKTLWGPTILTMNSEQIPRKPQHAPFTIQRRTETAFAEKKYFSEAPLPTNEHLALLEAFEADVIASVFNS
ncbi:MAG: hypothetical protein WA639_08240 [Candidatus Acidiferrum sp.]